MADIPEIEAKPYDAMETCIGLSVVILATFLGIVNVKDDNIVQKMQLAQADRIDNWNWFQARNVRGTVYESFAEELKVPRPGETPELAKLREEKSAYFTKRFQDQEAKAKEQKDDALKAKNEYDLLNFKDDQFDLCEAAMAIGLALMGVTALVKRWWLFFVALVPSVFGVLMGVAGFMGVDTSFSAVKWFIELLS